ncbi:hypothetical protein B0T17DRAFT_511659 [Bombardia bombarda]|uniref:Uncharacterized protein n=1 Tax=Bombardia bombarda TaxID=252184 RepID=A0AA39TM94_9PEZI|nr:hypothetical protein B0T17DRAFT_511659 [Bombardia bombarda]
MASDARECVRPTRWQCASGPCHDLSPSGTSWVLNRSTSFPTRLAPLAKSGDSGTTSLAMQHQASQPEEATHIKLAGGLNLGSDRLLPFDWIPCHDAASPPGRKPCANCVVVNKHHEPLTFFGANEIEARDRAATERKRLRDTWHGDLRERRDELEKWEGDLEVMCALPSDGERAFSLLLSRFYSGAPSLGDVSNQCRAFAMEVEQRPEVAHITGSLVDAHFDLCRKGRELQLDVDARRWGRQRKKKDEDGNVQR